MEWFFSSNGDAESVLYYDCKGSNRQTGRTSIVIGVVLLLYGVVVEAMYSVVLMVLFRKQYRQMTCYRIMISLALFGMAAIGICGLMTGVLWIVGANYCTHPNTIFISGCIAIGLWGGSCLASYILALNRVLDICNSSGLALLFDGHRSSIIISLPILYFLYFAFFTPPLLFNSDHMTWAFTPFTLNHNENVYISYPHIANNVLIVILTIMLYVVYSFVLLRRTKGQKGMLISQKSYLVQTSSICLMNFLSALLYVYMELLPSPQYFGLIGHLFWILGHGTPVVIYMFCNATIRREVNKMYAKFKPASKGEQSTTNGALSIGGAWAQRTRSI
ncbi:hypothetical protein Q1695_007477 [Nippostrongylus brasiliensis]|nr:hypothetical protein Q1695_007477 [Nippostrongylus brasiliensis]